MTMQSRRRKCVYGLLAVVAVLMVVLGRSPRADKVLQASRDKPVTSEASSGEQSGSTQPGASPPGVKADIQVNRDELAEVVETFGVPGRMVFLEFDLSPARIQLVRARGAEGRVKPWPVRQGPHLIEFEIYDFEGNRTYVGTAADPRIRNLEHPDSEDSARITSTLLVQDHGRLVLRLPGESRPSRLRLHSNDALNNPLAGHAPIEFQLRTSR